MQRELGRYWATARDYELAGDIQAAKAVYQKILQLDAGQAIAWLRLSDFERQAGRYRASHANALSAATAVGKNRQWKGLPYVNRQLLAFDERDVVHDLIVSADWSDPNILAQSAVLAQNLWLADRYEAALRLIDNASSRVPPSHLLAYARANALKYLGRMQEATDEFERCLAMSPHYAVAHWSLAYHAKSDPAGCRVGRIREAQSSLPQDSLDQVYLGYALFKELDDAGDVEQAWAALQEAALRMRRQVDYDSGREARGLSALMELTDATFVDPAHAPDPGNVPTFIVGMPRSGTTVLERILGAHSSVASAGELNVFSRSLSWVADCFYDVPPGEGAVNAVKDADFAEVGALYMRRTAGRYAGKTHLIDKNPANVFNAGFIAKAIPQAKIICLLRNPMDACFSNLKELFSGDSYGYSYDLTELADHYIRFRQLVAHWQRVLPGRFHVVEYETLVAEPMRTSEEVMGFCGLPFEPGCVDITRNEAPVSTASSSQVRQPINARGVDAWRKYANHLQPLETRLREAIPSTR